MIAFWPITWEPEFCQTWLGHFFPKSGHFSLNFEKGQGRPPPPTPYPPLVTCLDYFQEKLTQIFSKNPKNPVLGPFGDFLAQILAKLNFPGKKGSVSLWIFQLSNIVPKIRKNYCAIYEKNPKLTDWQTDNDFIVLKLDFYDKEFLR